MIPSPALRVALDAFAVAAVQAPRSLPLQWDAAFERAEQALLATIEAERVATSDDDSPHLHIPRDLLDGAGD